MQYRHSLLHDLLAGALDVLGCLFGVDLLEDLQHFPRDFVQVDVLVIKNVDFVDVVLLQLSQFVVFLHLLIAVLLQHCDSTQVFFLYLFELRLLLAVGLEDALDLVLLVVQVLDLSDVVLLCIVEDFQQVLGLVLDGQVFSLLGL